MKRMNKEFFVNGLSGLLILTVLLFIPGCVGEGDPDSEEAGLFKNIKLTASLKNYEHGNPVMTQEFGADPNVLEWEGRLYLFMTADSLTGTVSPPSGQVNSGNDYGYIKSLRVISTDDMVNWTQHPDLKKENISGGSWISNIWAPALAVKEINGVKKIFLYFSNGGGGTAVISAEHPLGPWSSPRTNNLITSSTPNSQVKNPFDPAVLVDDDGKAYIYYGGGTPDGGSAADYTSRHPDPKNIRAVELSEDMINIKGTPVTIDLPFSFEASEINKINGKYYYSYSTNPQVNHYAAHPENKFPEAKIIGDSFAIAYAVSDNPLGTFIFKGSILHNPGKMFSAPYNNNHHKIFQYKNNWYIVYHTKLLMMANKPSSPPPGSTDVLDWNYRSANIDAVNINADESIDLVNGTKTGVPQVGNFDPYRLIDGATMAAMGGISTEEFENAQGKKNMRITDIETGDWIALRGVDFGSEGAAQFKCRVQLPSNRSVFIQIRKGLNGEAIGYVKADTKGESVVTSDLLNKVTGIHDITFVFYGKGYKLEEWQFLK